ncbi:MAG: YicC/YloC family endoribonuclease, partial [Pseudomonadota bacterium]
MTASMTSFARLDRQLDSGTLVWEMRSVNHRYLELFVRMPEEFRLLEPKVRELTGRYLKRGKVEINLRYTPSATTAAVLSVNIAMVEMLHKALREVTIHAPDVKSPTSLDVLSWPGVAVSESRDMKPLHDAAMELLQQALKQMQQGRQREGEKLEAMIRERVTACRGQVELARERIPAVVSGFRQRLQEKLAEMKAELEPERLEQEMALLAQRLDVDEEMDRLGAHLDEVEHVLERAEPIGRRLDFLMQELNREANTLASKSADQQMTAIGVELKV